MERGLEGARADLDRTIIELIRSGVDTGSVEAQIARLNTLQAAIGSADRASLATLASEVTAAIVQSQTIAQQVQRDANTASAASAPSFAETARASRAAVADAMDYARRAPLTFSSPEDERAYRDREAERGAYIAAQQAKNSPQGDLNAAGAAIGQMADANAHGARGAEFDEQWAELVRSTERLREQVRVSGGSTKEFDEHLRDDLRRIMKTKGLADAQIEGRLAAYPDQLEAAKTFVNDDADLRAIERSAERAQALGPLLSNRATSEMRDLIASIPVSGITMPEGDHAGSPSHGLAVSVGVPGAIRSV